MNRRKVIRGGLGFLTLGAFGPSWGARPCDPTFFGEPGSSCGSSGPGDGSRPLETLANSMSSNTWRLWTTGDTAGFKSLSVNSGSPPRSILEYSHNFFWNSFAKELHIRGGGASSGGGSTQRHLRYNDAVGSWDAVTPWHTGWAHQWGHFAGDPATGDLYFRQRTTTNIYKWTYAAYPATISSWPLFDSGSFDGGVNANALGFFPDYNGGQGGLVFYSTAGDVDTISATDASLTNWSQLSSGLFSGVVSVEGILVYLPGQQWMMYGGGKGQWTSDNWPDNFQLGKIEADGTVTRLNDTPFAVACNTAGKIVGHSNGRVFGIDNDANLLREYNEGADSWPSIGTLPFNAHWSAACMIDEFNVIYVAAQLGSAGNDPVQEWLYKL